jgi:hypothetical protein
MQVIHKQSNSPLVISIPHSGTDIPQDIAPICNLATKREHTDWELQELVAPLSETTLVANVSRYIVDVNRFKLRTGKATQPIIPRIDEVGNQLFNNYPSKKKQADWLQRYYSPYYLHLENLLNEKLEQHERVLLVDLHSYDDKLFQTSDIILGTRKKQTINEELLAQLQRLFHEEGISTQVDTPFSGGNIITTFGKRPRIEAVQIEVPYSLYLEGHSLHEERSTALQQQLIRIFQKVWM